MTVLVVAIAHPVLSSSADCCYLSRDSREQT
jgi:hypothetical protein